MKILKPGKVKFIYRIVTCSHCDCQFEILPKDRKSDREGFYVICPNTECRSFIKL